MSFRRIFGRVEHRRLAPDPTKEFYKRNLRQQHPKNRFCEAKGSPQESSSFLSCWGTRYSFFSHRKEKKE